MEPWHSLLPSDVRGPCLLWSVWIKVKPLGKSSSFEKLLLFLHCSALKSEVGGRSKEQTALMMWSEKFPWAPGTGPQQELRSEERSHLYHTATQTGWYLHIFMLFRPAILPIYANQNLTAITDLEINKHCSYYSCLFLSYGRCRCITGFISAWLYCISFPLSWTHDGSGLDEHTEFQTVADSNCIRG